jgi:hypothetical protein
MAHPMEVPVQVLHHASGKTKPFRLELVAGLVESGEWFLTDIEARAAKAPKPRKAKAEAEPAPAVDIPASEGG